MSNCFLCVCIMTSWDNIVSCCQLMATTAWHVARTRPLNCGTHTSWRTAVPGCYSRPTPGMAMKWLMPSAHATAHSCAPVVLTRLSSCGMWQLARSPTSTEDMPVCNVYMTTTSCCSSASIRPHHSRHWDGSCVFAHPCSAVFAWFMVLVVQHKDMQTVA